MTPHRISNRCARSIGLVFAALALICAPTIDAKSKLKGRAIGPTGIRGEYSPKWPKTPVEVIVAQLEEGSPADGTKLKAGDVIVGAYNQKFEGHVLWAMAEVCERLIDLILYWHLPLFVLYRAAVKIAILDRGVTNASGCECIPCHHMDIQPYPHEKEKFQ